jgi:hypothetical protein
MLNQNANHAATNKRKESPFVFAPKSISTINTIQYSKAKDSLKLTEPHDLKSVKVLILSLIRQAERKGGETVMT